MKEQLPAQLEAELLLFDFPRKIIPTFIFCTPFLLVSIAEVVKETEDFFYKFYAGLLDSLLQVVNSSSEVRGRSLNQFCNLQLFLYQVRNSQEIKQEIVSGRNKSCVVRTCL